MKPNMEPIGDAHRPYVYCLGCGFVVYLSRFRGGLNPYRYAIEHLEEQHKFSGCEGLIRYWDC